MPLYIYPHEAPYPRSALGWDGAEFRVISVDGDGRVIPAEVPRYFNYADPYHQAIIELNATVTADELTSFGPAANHVLIVTTMLAYDATTNITAIRMGIAEGANRYWSSHHAPAAIGDPCEWSGKMIVPIGHTPQARFEGTVAGDDLYFYVTGYQMVLTW